MSGITKSGFDTYIDANIFTNGVGSITGLILNTALHYIANTLLWAEQRRDRAVSLTKKDNPNAVVFVDLADSVDPFMAGTSVLIAGVRCYDASGNNVDYNITDVTNAGFNINVSVDCSMDYVACGKESGLPT